MSEVMPDRMLQAALRYVNRRGWPVFPLQSIREGVCTCSAGPKCGSNSGKHPRTKHGLYDASTDERQIREWWTRWPDANIGVPTGAISGLLVLDIDPRNHGDDSLAALLHQFGSLPPTLEALTGGGGRHIVFQYPATGGPISSGRLEDGIDVKADGGYIVVAPSLHLSGNRYTWQ